jgi:hypothetical protein
MSVRQGLVPASISGLAVSVSLSTALPAKVCAHLHRRKIQPTNEEELANAMIEEWDTLDQEWINGLIAEQRHWIFEVVACRGWMSAN